MAVAQGHGGNLKIKRDRLTRILRRANQPPHGRRKLAERSRIGLARQVLQLKARLIQRKQADVQVPRVEYRKQANIGISPADAEQLAPAPVLYAHPVQQHPRKRPHINPPDSHFLPEPLGQKLRRLVGDARLHTRHPQG